MVSTQITTSEIKGNPVKNNWINEIFGTSKSSTSESNTNGLPKSTLTTSNGNRYKLLKGDLRQSLIMVDDEGGYIVENEDSSYSYYDSGGNLVNTSDSISGLNTGSGSSSSGSSTGTISPLLKGEMTFEELVGEICNGLDLLFLVKRSTVVVTDYETIFAEAKYLRDTYHDSVKSEDIALWQLEDASYEFDVNEYGFYNTVKVRYKDGIVTESYTDYVRVFGEVPITYDEPTIDKTTAIMKAKAYLAAHVREFDMTLQATILHDGDIDIGDIVTIENPLTLRDSIHSTNKEDPEFLFVMSNSISWEAESFIKNDIELRYGPESPEKKEVQELGADYTKSSGDVDSAINEVGQQYSNIGYCHSCQTGDCVKQTGCGDCWGMSDLLACELQNRGVTTRILQYPTGSSSRHRSVQYMGSDGSWRDFPYRQYGFNSAFNNTGGTVGGVEVSKSCGG